MQKKSYYRSKYTKRDNDGGANDDNDNDDEDNGLID